MRIIIETSQRIEESILLNAKQEVDIFTVGLDNFLFNGDTVITKHTTIISQLHSRDAVSINTVFSFLLKLKNGADSLYYKKLHTKFLISYRELFKNIDYIIYVYKGDLELINYLEIECFKYEVIDTMQELIHKINKNI